MKATALRASLVPLLTVGCVSLAGAATFTVDDPGDPVGVSTTLRTAITQANASADPLDIIVFNLPANSVITLASELPLLSDDVIIDGANVPGLAINGAGQFRIFNIDTAADEVVMINDLQLTAGGTSGSAGDNGGAILIAGSEQVTLTNVSIEGSTADASGGGIYVGAAELTISGGVFSNNVAGGVSASEGGGAIYALGGTITIADGASFSDNQASGAAGSGGAIHLSGGSTEVTGGDFTRNLSNRAGGALEISAAATQMTVTIDGVSFVENDAGLSPGNGGAIHVTAPSSGAIASVDVSGGGFTGNIAGEEGGGLWNDAGGTLTIDGSAITGNTASGPGADQGGGGIFNNGGTVTLTSATVDTNIADGALGSGGGVLSVGGSLDVTGGSISGNTSVRAGGGIEVAAAIDNAGANLTGVVVANNATGGSPGNGGGLHVTDPPSDLIDSVVIVTDGSFTGNTASAEGGGLWNAAGGTMGLRGTIITGNTASGSSSDQGGGGVFNDGGVVMISDATIEGNAADGSSGSGGGILNDGGRLTVTGGTVSDNSAVRAGGGIEANTRNLRDSVIWLDGVTVSLNTTGSSPGNGGGIHVSDPIGDNASTFTINAGSITENTASQEGGGLWNDAGGTLQITGTNVSLNRATAANAVGDVQGGGGVFNNGGRVSVTDATISGNVVSGVLGADDGGGGVLNDARSNLGSVTLRGTIITDNTASVGSGSGGGILSVGGSLEITGGRVSGNSTARAGGGVELRAVEAEASLAVDQTDFRGNATGGAPGNGGAIHVTAPVTGMAATVTVDGGTYAGNTAAAEGGALWNDANAVMNVSASTLSGNTASGDGADQGGGGFFNNGGTAALTGVVVSGNVADGAAGSGGGLLNDGGTLNLTGLTVSSNTAVRAGGGLEITTANARASTVTVANTTFDQNTTGASPGNGGGIHVTDIASGPASLLTLVGGALTGNSAAAEGGGVWNDVGGTLIIGGSTITGNVAGGDSPDQGGGGVFNNGGQVTIASATIDNNIADGLAGSGGGILNDGGSFSLADGSVSGNSAVRAGGGLEITTANARDSDVLVDGVVFDANVTGASPGNGGAVHVTDPVGDNASSLSILASTVTNNTADQEGGGLWNDAGGSMSVEATQIADNVANAANAAADIQGGGGVFNNGGTVTLTDVTLDSNDAAGPAEADDGGGGVANVSGGSVTIRDSVISANTADSGAGNGGGILNAAGATLQVNNVQFSGNSAARAGGAVENEGVASLTEVTASQNSAGVNGGMLHITGPGSTSFSSSTISGNTAANEGGGLWLSGAGVLNLTTTGVDGNAAPFGGGVFVDAGSTGSGSLTVDMSAVTGNTGSTNGGGLALEAGTVTLVNSTVSSNSGGDGGGIFNDGAAVNLSFVTVADNNASGPGGGVNSDGSGSVNADNTIIGGNAGAAGNDFQGALTSGDFLIISDTAGATITGTTTNSSLDVDPLLGPLADNGGPTLTHLPLAGSPAIGGADNTSCPGMDQRTFARNDPDCDVGAVEVGGVDTDLVFADSFEN
ncbi:MAG: choice-of-anchor Q domain-containing protein [Pseudomonadota bacterium]